MRVVSVSMSSTNGKYATFCAHEADLRWRSNGKGGRTWSGRSLRPITPAALGQGTMFGDPGNDHGTCFTLYSPEDNGTECRRMNELEDALSKRLGIPAKHREFPSPCPRAWSGR